MEFRNEGPVQGSVERACRSPVGAEVVRELERSGELIEEPIHRSTLVSSDKSHGQISLVAAPGHLCGRLLVAAKKHQGR